jgi:hypothetical protein
MCMLGLMVNSYFGISDLIGEPNRFVVPTLVLSGLNKLYLTYAVGEDLSDS